MGSIISRIKKVNKRIITQGIALVSLNIYFLEFRSICIPALNCHSCPAAVFACPIGVLVNFSSFRIFPFFAIGILGLVGIIGGRLVCGWFCPFGLLQDGLYKLPTPKTHVWHKFSYAKYAVLIGLVILVPFFNPNSPLLFCRLCPAGTLESAIPWRLMGISSGDSFGFFLRMIIFSGVLILVISISRGFCRLLCPLGAIFSIFNKFSLFRIRLTKNDCNRCGICSQKCPVSIDPVTQINSPECIRCLECISTNHLKLGIK